MLTLPILSQFAFFVVIAVFMGHVAALSRERQEDQKRAEAVAARLETAVAEKTRDLRASLQELDDRSRLEANERLAALGTLSAGIAHEIRNPLAAIMSALEESPSILAEVELGLRGPEGRGAVAEPAPRSTTASRRADSWPASRRT
jgi:signal transduction histidine kinase